MTCSKSYTLLPKEMKVEYKSLLTSQPLSHTQLDTSL